MERYRLKKHWIAAAWLLGGVLVITAALKSGKPEVIDNARRWVGTWATAPQLGDATNAPPVPGFRDSTLRQTVRVSIGGKQLRVRFSNAFGTSALTVTSAHVAVSRGAGAIRPETDKPLTFHGRLSVSIPPGALQISDPLGFDLSALSDLAVTIHLNGAPNDITTHPGSNATTYLQAGDLVSSADLPQAARTDHWYFLNGVDVLAEGAGGAIVALGDSITDGMNSTTDRNGRWPDWLARRLQASGSTRGIGVLNAGMYGNRLLNDGYGPNALARLDRDVLAQSGVRWLIVEAGINDIGTAAIAQGHEPGPTVQEIIGAYEQIILRAHAHNIRVYGATIMPYEGAFNFTRQGEADRQAVNNWIRTSGKFDEVIDLDAATRDPQRPSRLSAWADSGDHLHPTDGGYRIISDVIDLNLFAK